MSDPPPVEHQERALLDRRGMLMGLGLCLASGLAYVRMPKGGVQPLAHDALDSMIPKTIGRWKFETTSGLVLPPPDELEDRIYDDILTRVYVSSSAPAIMFLIAYSAKQDGLLIIHRPETCYPAGGFKLTDTQIKELPLSTKTDLPIRTFSATSDIRNEQVLYWTRVGEDIPTSWFEQRVSVIKSNLRGDVPDGILVRASTIGPDTSETAGYLEQFIQALAGSLAPQGRHLLFGYS